MARFKKHDFKGGASTAKLSRRNLVRLRAIAPIVDEAVTKALDRLEKLEAK